MSKSDRAGGEPAGGAPEPGEKLTSWAAGVRAVHESASEAFVIIERVLDRLRESPRILQESGASKLRHTNVKLREVSSTTESAAMEIMDGVGRALELVDRLEDEGEPTATSAELRDELFGIMSHLQFQDITAQQLQYTSSLLNEVEGELLEFVARLGAPGRAREEAARAGAAPAGFDPRATMLDAEGRQAAADALLRLPDPPTGRRA